MTIIKRYSNRKLYHSDKRAYITLDDIADMIRSGDEVEVVDHDSGQDLTAAILAQIIYEQEKKIGGLLPHHILARLIRTGGTRMHALQDSFLAFLDPLQYVESEFRRRFDCLIEDNQISADEKDRLLELLLSPHLLPVYEADLDLETLPPEEMVSQEEVDDLLQRIQALEDELKSLSTRSSPAA